MHLEAELAALSPKRGSLITIGVFDGVHIGHQALLCRLVENARSRGLLSIAVTFRQHPEQLLAPQKKFSLIEAPDDKIERIRDTGVDMTLILDFDRELADHDAESFVALLRRYLNMNGMVLGWDFALGRSREGSLLKLEELGKELDFSMEVVGAVMLNGEIVSSTAIRQALSAGDIDRANAMLGRPFSLQGEVVKGSHRGTELGFPTANLDIPENISLPADGVYAARVQLGAKSLPAAVFIGRRPTFGGIERIVEAHIMDYTGNLYGRRLKTDIISRMRGELKFENIEALKSQIERDVTLIRQKLAVG